MGFNNGVPLLQHNYDLVDELSVMGCAGSRILPCWVTGFSGDLGRGFCVWEMVKSRTECGFFNAVIVMLRWTKPLRGKNQTDVSVRRPRDLYGPHSVSCSRVKPFAESWRRCLQQILSLAKTSNVHFNTAVREEVGGYAHKDQESRQ